MPAQEVKRLYHMSDALLKQQSDDVANLSTRDAAEFATRGVTPASITAFKQKTEAFAAFPTDPELLGPVITATEEKDALGVTVKQGIRGIRNMAENKYGNGGKYKIFGFEGMDKLPDEQLFYLAKRVGRVATTLLTELAGEGLTTTVISNLLGTATLFDAAIDKASAAVETRDLQTGERRRLGNVLYREFIRLAGIGKTLFADVNEAKYNDYVVYGSEEGEAPALKGEEPKDGE